MPVIVPVTPLVCMTLATPLVCMMPAIVRVTQPVSTMPVTAPVTRRVSASSKFNGPASNLAIFTDL